MKSQPFSIYCEKFRLDRWRREWGGAVRGLRYSVRVLDKLSRRFDKPLTLRE
jgi:hypothetical protein